MTTIPIKFTTPYSWLFTVLASPPHLCDIQIDGNRVRVRLGWTFHATFDRRDVVSVSPDGAKISVGVDFGAPIVTKGLIGVLRPFGNCELALDLDVDEPLGLGLSEVEFAEDRERSIEGGLVELVVVWDGEVGVGGWGALSGFGLRSS